MILIKQHKKEEREEREAYWDAIHKPNKIEAGYSATNEADKDNGVVKLLKKYFARHSMPFCHYSGHNMWIIKATKLNQG